MRRIPITVLTALVGTLLSISAWTARAGDPDSILSQEPVADEERDVAAAPVEVHLNLIDQKLALSLAVDAQAQIEMCEFALAAVTGDMVRQFVTLRLEDQRDFARELGKLTNGRTLSAIARAQREIEADRAPDKPQEKGFRLLSVRTATAMLTRIRLEIHQQYAQQLHAELEATSSEAFDRSFLRCDLLNQMQMLAALEVFQRQASADFAQVIHRAWQRAKVQIDSGRQLLLQLETAQLADSAPTDTPRVEAIDVKLQSQP